MKYKIEETTHEYQGKTMHDLVLTFENGKRWKLIPLTKQDSKASKSLFYALLTDSVRS